MSRVLRTSLARRDIEEVGRHLEVESHSQAIALDFLDRIDVKCRLYATQPVLGASCPDLGRDVRVFSVGNYLDFYRPLVDGIEVLRVLHGSRDLPSAWAQE